MRFHLSSFRSLSQDPGVYIFEDKEGNVLYVGKARNLRERVKSYFRDYGLGKKTSVLVSQIAKVKTIKVFSEIESFLLEANLIQKYKPKYNVRFMDGKSYPFIRITKKDKYPKVLFARRMEDKNSLYFGPYPNAKVLKQVLKTIRRIFPYQSFINHPKKPCLYYHLGLCPCPEVLGDKSYGKIIKHIVNFLKGNTKKVLKDLGKERESFVKLEEFEKASNVQKKIESVVQITSPLYRPYYYEKNPNLTSDVRASELALLNDVLKIEGIDVVRLRKIECFDISSIVGKFATGSLVVFIDGERSPSLYRRFRVRKDSGPNDTAMMSEIIKRRFNHREWEFPDLVIVDGGKGQVSTALRTLAKMHINIPVIGLAKKLETIITPDLREISLESSSKALHLIMRIRDEAHRFAITYHKKLRKTYLLETA